MPTCLSFLKKLLQTLDLFPNSNFLRYNGDDKYTTVTGGVLSIGIIVIFVILFASMGLQTANK